MSSSSNKPTAVLGTERAREGKVPAYRILTNKSLEALAVMRPASPEALLDVPGIGPAKTERFGTALLALLAGETTSEEV